MAESSYLYAPLTSLKGIGEKTAALFAKAGVSHVAELLRYYPRDFTFFPEPVTVDQAEPDQVVSLSLLVTSPLSLRHARQMAIVTGSGSDEAGKVSLVWFHAPYLKNSIRAGSRYIFRGVIRKKGQTLTMQQPAIYKPDQYAALSGTMQPLYPLTKGLTNHTVAKAVRQALNEACYMEETLPEEIREAEGLCHIREALFSIHFPRDEAAFAEARKRLAFEEFYDFIRRLKALKAENEEALNTAPMIEVAECKRMIERLPYRMTKAQLRVWEEIKEDLSGDHLMNRLIQGDVGSGKTILALLALSMCAANGYQGAIMAPTSVLAMQHFETFRDMAKTYRLPLRPVLLTGALSAKEKREAQEAVADGTYNVIIGTHALFQEKVRYKNLALVVTDEQHRFGVRQREALEDKSQSASADSVSSPHVLSMSATPIPRTLAIILYGDLHVSVLDEMPAERKAVKNAVVDSSFREKTWQMLLREIRAGRQAYIVCPMIEPGELNGAQNVTEYTELLRSAWPEDVRIASLHGKMKPKEKDRVMEEFAAHRTDVLVTTTVIEVGVNVPNATIMMIEDAQRFGLAQLHQLRGRVGRGEAQSYCVFVDTSPDAAKGKVSERLSVMKNSNDGFHIAEEDLKLRGPGELFGLRQSGALSFKIADIYRDAELLTKAAGWAERI